MSNNITRWRTDDPPNTLLAIDPGASFPKSKVPYAGAALFQWGMLVWAALIKCPTVVGGKPLPPFARPNTLVRAVCDSARIARRTIPPKTIKVVDDAKYQRARTKARSKVDMGEGLNVLIVENPLIYRNGVARPKDIVELAKIYGAFMGGIDAEFYSGPGPSEWKGSIDGAQLNERVVRVLNQAERMILIDAQRSGQGGLTDHCVDAAGLGLFGLGRMGVAGVV